MNSVKIVIIGDGGVGKSSFVERIQTGNFDRKYEPTMGVEAYPIPLTTNKGNIVLNMWDVAGQERFSNNRAKYYTEARVVVLMFDVGSRISYRNIEQWYREAKQNIGDIPFVLCGNKCDIGTRCVFPEDMEEFLKDKDIRYYDISVRSNHNINETVSYILKKIYGEDTIFL